MPWWAIPTFGTVHYISYYQPLKENAPQNDCLAGRHSYELAATNEGEECAPQVVGIYVPQDADT